jgi:hypothetical protein
MHFLRDAFSDLFQMLTFRTARTMPSLRPGRQLGHRSGGLELPIAATCFVTDASKPRSFRIAFWRQVPAAASSSRGSLE